MKTIPHCLECGVPISWGVHLFSRRIYGHSLCIKDQCLIEESGADARVVDFYLALKSRGIPAKLKYFDGYQFSDIALPERVYINVKQPCFGGPPPIITDLSRNPDTDEKHFLKILISYSILENSNTFTLAVKEIAKVCTKAMKKPVLMGVKFSFSSAQWQ